MKEKRSQVVRMLNQMVFLMIIIAVFESTIAFAQVAESGAPYVIEPTPRPMSDAADWLQGRFAQPVTYEDPILISSDDTQPVEYATRKMGLLPKNRGFSVRIEAGLDKNITKLDSGLLNKVVDAYHAQTDGPRFKILTSQFGLHIVPSQVRSQNGKFVGAKLLLDNIITVPVKRRAPSEHFKALCEAISVITGVKLKDFMPWLDAYYAPLSTRAYRSNEEEYREKVSFEWGATNVVARDAVIDFLEHSSTTLSWKILCEPAEKYCVFNLLPIEVNVTGSDGKSYKKAISHDRDER